MPCSGDCPGIVHYFLLVEFLIGLDNFKTVNDNMGHLVGDEVLIHTARTLKTVFCDSDIVARLGGDEFLVYAPTMDDVELIKN
ncbi:MAG: GGDEF domain-containing protein [Desulfovibrio sp.]|nr:GGDEF domain-containing protein [Desulfovibrio sp.]